MDEDTGAASLTARRAGQEYASLLEWVHRCAQAVQSGAWADLAEAGGGLATAADELSATAAALTREEHATGPADVLSATRHRLGARNELLTALHPR